MGASMCHFPFRKNLFLHGSSTSCSFCWRAPALKWSNSCCSDLGVSLLFPSNSLLFPISSVFCSFLNMFTKGPPTLLMGSADYCGESIVELAETVWYCLCLAQDSSWPIVIQDNVVALLLRNPCNLHLTSSNTPPTCVSSNLLKGLPVWSSRSCCDVTHYSPQYCLLSKCGDTTSDWPPARLCATDLNFLSLAVQLFHPLVHLSSLYFICSIRSYGRPCQKTSAGAL